MIRILLAEDHAVVRRGVVDILREHRQPIEIDEARTVQETLRLLRTKQFDLLILDISFPDGNGLELYQQMKQFSPNTKCLFLTMHPEERYARRVFRTGAHGYITKDRAAEELLEAVETILSGGKFITHSLAELLIEELNPKKLQPHEHLSNRELQVALALADGERISSIAERLSLSPKTISTYRRRILDKLSLDSTADLVRYVLTHGLGED